MDTFHGFNFPNFHKIRKHCELISVQITQLTLDSLPVFLPPANEVCEGNVFTGVCLSTGGMGLGEGSLSRGSLWPGVSVQGPGGLCPGHSLSERPPSHTVKSGRYASYWNAFLYPLQTVAEVSRTVTLSFKDEWHVIWDRTAILSSERALIESFSFNKDLCERSWAHELSHMLNDRCDMR